MELKVRYRFDSPLPLYAFTPLHDPVIFNEKLRKSCSNT